MRQVKTMTWTRAGVSAWLGAALGELRPAWCAARESVEGWRGRAIDAAHRTTPAYQDEQARLAQKYHKGR